MRKVIGLFGLPAAGKSYLSNNVLIRDQRFLCVKASEIIKNFDGVVALSELNESSVDRNQRVLIDGFRLFREENADKNIVIELHNVVETPKQLIEVDCEVFKNLNLDLACFLVTNPKKLMENRMADKDRERLILSVDEIDRRQKYAVKRFRECFGEMKIPIGILEGNVVSEFLGFVDDF